jgi:drug/metabolite transporter (DMT)-like permease
VAVLGVGIMMGGAVSDGHLLGNLLGLGMALCMAIMMLIIRDRHENPDAASSLHIGAAVSVGGMSICLITRH